MKRLILVTLVLIVLVGCGLNAEEATPTPVVEIPTPVPAVEELPEGLEYFMGYIIPSVYADDGIGASGFPIVPFCSETTGLPCDDTRADQELEKLIIASPEVDTLIRDFKWQIESANPSPFAEGRAVWMVWFIGNRIATEGVVRVALAWENEGVECEHFLWQIASDADIAMCQDYVHDTAHLCLEISGTFEEGIVVKAAGLTKGYDVTCDDLR